MSSETIPQQTRITCDICKRLCAPHGPATRSAGAALMLSAHGEWTDAGWSIDVCDQCLNRVNVVIANLQKTTAPTP